MAVPPELGSYPLANYLLSGYLSKRSDEDNFPPSEFPELFQRYENIFSSGLEVLGLTKEALKNKPEFNFDSGDAANLEGGIAILRAVEVLRLGKFLNIALVKPTANQPNADLTCDKNGQKVCLEVKAITKQSSGRQGRYFADQLYEKVLDSFSKARTQLKSTAAEAGCTVKIFVCVVNWFAQSIYLGQNDYQYIANRLERDEDQTSLNGIDGVWFVTKMGQQFLFLNDTGKSIDS